ncbi:MAG: penicillin-binding protein, partial [Clostridia bacterium]|nr:penicillin-binding protein [Clostridia bacterium]
MDEKLFDSSRSFESTLFYAEGEVIETSGSIRKLHYTLDEISPYVSRGFIAVEDRMFYEHPGVDIKRTALAAINLIVKKDDTFGASTITQQVIKNISGDNQVKIRRKICEILRALHIERIYTKNDILEVYLNVIPMGDNIYGIGAASRAYFGKEPSDLSVEEAATLIGITNAPTAYSPYLNPDACLRKRNIVLGVMQSQGVITDSEYNEAASKPLTVIAREDREDRFNSWFVETAIQEICEDMSHLYGITESAARLMLLGGGYKVYTTMDRSVQNTLEEYFEDYDNLADETSNGLNYAMVITDSESGNLLGIIGRAGEKKGNRLLSHATTPHIPASTLKPIALYAPLIDQEMINWATVFDDVPVKFLENNREYPKNSPDVYDGLTTVKDAIRLSKNTVAVRLSEMLTPKGIYNSLIDNFGFDTLVERDG